MPRRTVTEIVGAAIRAVRREREMSQKELAALLAEHGLEMSRTTVNQLELGRRAISVDDLVQIGVALGTPPHCLLYPPEPNIVVGPSDEHSIEATALADWLYKPDGHRLTNKSERSEKRRYLESIGMADRLPDELIENLRQHLYDDDRVQEIAQELSEAQEGEPFRLPGLERRATGARDERQKDR